MWQHTSVIQALRQEATRLGYIVSSRLLEVYIVRPVSVKKNKIKIKKPHSTS